jgi:hypothetical protein
MKYLYRLQPRKKRNSRLTQQSYHVKGLSKAQKRLLQVGPIRKSRSLNEFYALVMHTLLAGGNFNCGTDGGLKTKQGIYGIVVSVSRLRKD